MAALNVKNRTLFSGDNLDVLRGINSECVDLIHLDPPFNSNRTYEAPIGSEAAGAAFKDTWTLVTLQDIWADIGPISSRSKERDRLSHAEAASAAGADHQGEFERG